MSNKVESREKFYQRSFIVISSDLCNVIKRIVDKMSRQKKIALKSKYSLDAWSPGKWLSLEVFTSNFFDLIFKLTIQTQACKESRISSRMILILETVRTLYCRKIDILTL